MSSAKARRRRNDRNLFVTVTLIDRFHYGALDRKTQLFLADLERVRVEQGGGGQYPYPKEVWSPAGTSTDSSVFPFD